MKYRFILLHILLLMLVALCSTAYSNTDERELDELYQKNLRLKQQLYESTVSFIDRNLDFVRLDDLYFKMGELSSELFVTDPEKILFNFKKVLELNPDYSLRDIVLYNIAYYSSDYVKQQRDLKRNEYIQTMISSGRLEPIIRWDEEYRLSEESLAEAISAYGEILTRFPDSRYFSESIYRLSVLLYEIGLDADEPIIYYQRARDLLDFVAERDDDQYQNLGLYQRGWAHFSTGRYEEAISDFSRILNIVPEEPLLRAYFEQDAMENIAFCLERMDQSDYSSSARSARYAQEHLPRLLDSEKHIKTIIQRVIRIKMELNAPFQAIDYYGSFLEMFPLSINNPSIIDTIATIYQRYSFMFGVEERVRELVTVQKERIVDLFKVDSSWYQYNSQLDLQEQLEIIRVAYEFIEPRYLNRFVNNQNEENLNLYRELVNNYARFPEFSDERGREWIQEKQKKIIEAMLVLAQIEERPFYYLLAHQLLTDYNNIYPGNSDYLDFEFRKFLVIETIFDQIFEGLDEKSYQDETKDLILTRADVKDLFITCSDDFLRSITMPAVIEGYEEDIVRALYKRALIYLTDEESVEAEIELNNILDYVISDDLKRAVFIYLAQIKEKDADYPGAEQYYRYAAEFSLDEEDRENIKNHYRAQIQAQAHLFTAESLYKDGADEYLRLAEEYRETELDRYVGFTREAINSFIKAGEYQTTIDLLIGLTEQLSRPEEAYFLYSSAWNIADTLMADYDQKQELRIEYIDRYPFSNESYNTRYDMIEELAKQPESKYEAAKLLLDLHDDAFTGLIDHGEDQTADIYYHALDMYHDYEDRELIISVMSGFINKYPDDQRTLAIMELMALEYSALGKEQEYEKLARLIFLRNPNSTLYEGIARNKILGKYNSVTAHFLEEQFDDMDDQMRAFEALDRKYREDNLFLPLEEFYLDFEDYKYATNRILQHRALITQLEDTLNEIEQNYINASPGELIRVNQYTTWQQNLATGDRRLERIIERAHGYQDRIIAMLQEARSYEKGISSELNTRSLYTIGRVYDRTAEVIDIQLDRFVRISNQFLELRRENEEEYLSTVYFINESYKTPYINYLISESADWYNLLLTTFVDRIGHYDQYTEAARNRLSEWGLLKETISIYSNTEWLATRADNLVDWEQLHWGRVSIIFEAEQFKELIGLNNSEAQPIWLSSEEEGIPISERYAEDLESVSDNTLFYRSFEVTGEVLEATMSLVSYEMSSIWINGQAVQPDANQMNDAPTTIFLVNSITIAPEKFTRGDNQILIKSEGTGESQALLFNLDLLIRLNKR